MLMVIYNDYYIIKLYYLCALKLTKIIKIIKVYEKITV